MKTKEYLKEALSLEINEEIVKQIEKEYNTKLPKVAKALISASNSTIFFEDGKRILSIGEITDAEKDLHVNFKSKGLIPIIDCSDNDFIVYDFLNKRWAKFNIIDEILFKIKNNIDELL